MGVLYLKKNKFGQLIKKFISQKQNSWIMALCILQIREHISTGDTMDNPIIENSERRRKIITDLFNKELQTR